MAECSCNGSNNTVVDLNLAKQDFKKLRRHFPENNFPEERILEIYPGIYAVAVGVKNGRLGGMILPVLGVGFWLRWKFLEFTVDPNGNTSFDLRVDLFLTTPDRDFYPDPKEPLLPDLGNPFRQWQIQVKCDDTGCFSSFAVEEIINQLTCGIDSDSPNVVLFSQSYASQEGSDCQCWNECKNGWCGIVCAVSCLFKR